MSWRPDQPMVWEEKTTAPGVTNDANNGYLVGDIWVDETADNSYICVDSTAGAAVWERVYGSGDSPSFANVTVTGLTASKPVFTDANKKLVSTGTLAIDQGGTGQITAALAFGALKQAATESATGVVEFATPTETIAGTSSALAVHPAGNAAALAVVANPKARGQGVALTAAAAAAIFNAHSTVYSNATNNFGIGGLFACPSWTPAATQILRNKWAANVGYKLELILTSGIFRLTLNDTVYDSAVPGGGAASNLLARSSHSILAVPTVGATTTTVSFYLDGNLLSTTAAQTNEDVTNTLDMYTGGTSAVRYAMTVYDTYDLNLAPTATEWKLAYLEGIPESWKWGSQTPTTQDAMAADNTADWTKDSGSTTLTFDTDHYEYANDTAGGYGFRRTATVGANKKYRISIDMKDGTASGIAILCRAMDSSSGVVWSTASGTTTASWQTISAEYTTLDTDAKYYVYTTTDLNTTNIEFRNFKVEKIGATLALEGEGMQPAPGQCLDSSSNKLHAMQPATGSSLVRPKRDFEVRWTNTWAGTHEAQYVGGVNQAVLPVGCYITSIIGVVSGATIEDIILGDGSDTDHWVAITTGLAAGTTAFTIANAISDGTNYKLVVDPDANFTGSIAWTIRGIILQ